MKQILAALGLILVTAPALACGGGGYSGAMVSPTSGPGAALKAEIERIDRYNARLDKAIAVVSVIDWAATSVITVAGLAVPGAKPLSVLYSGTRTGIKMATGDEATRMSTSAKVVAKQSVQGGPSVVGVSASSILAVSLIVYDGVGVAQGLMTAFSPK